MQADAGAGCLYLTCNTAKPRRWKHKRSDFAVDNLYVVKLLHNFRSIVLTSKLKIEGT